MRKKYFTKLVLLDLFFLILMPNVSLAMSLKDDYLFGNKDYIYYGGSMGVLRYLDKTSIVKIKEDENYRILAANIIFFPKYAPCRSTAKFTANTVLLL